MRKVASGRHGTRGEVVTVLWRGRSSRLPLLNSSSRRAVAYLITERIRANARKLV
jgi:hypothetical protein